MPQVESALSRVLSYIIPVVEACGALVVILGVVYAIIAYVRGHFAQGRAPLAPLRVQLGQSMVLGLEFQVAADVLRTAANPTWDDILLLAVLIGIRSVLNFLLEWELAHLNGVEHAPPHAPMRRISDRRREARERIIREHEAEQEG